MDTRPTGTDRATFLANVAARVHGGLPDNLLRPVVADGAPPPIDYTVDVSDPVAAFTAALEALTGTVVDARDRDSVLRRIVRERGIARAVVSRDPECEGVVALLADLGVEVAEPGDVPAAAAADIGITGAAYGIALTGSIVVDSTRAGARTPSLLPPVHLALLRREAIVPDPGALFRHLGDAFPGGLPSNLVLVTGPSKSADIELILTIGVHGPKELIVGLL